MKHFVHKWATHAEDCFDPDRFAMSYADSPLSIDLSRLARFPPRVEHWALPQRIDSPAEPGMAAGGQVAIARHSVVEAGPR